MSVRESFWDYFWLTKILFQSAGIIPIGGSQSLWKELVTDLLALGPVFYGWYVVLPQLYYILLRSHPVDDLLEAVIIVVIVVGGQLRSIVIAINRPKLASLFSACETLWNYASPSDFRVTLVWVSRARLFCTAYFFAAHLSVALFVLNTIVKQLSSPPNSTITYYPFRYAGDSRISPYYEIRYTIQVTIGFVGMSGLVASDMIGTLMVLYMCGQLALIRSWLQDISENGSYSKTKKVHQDLRESLRKCIRRHQVVMDICSDLEDAVQNICLIQIISGMYIGAISGARLTESIESYRFIGPLLVSISGLFFSCWPVDTLSSASSAVAHALYEIPWYSCSASEETMVMIMLARSQRPANLTAGKFAVLSLETFASIVSSGVSFCMVLSNF